MCAGPALSIVAPSGNVQAAEVVDKASDWIKVHYDRTSGELDEWILVTSSRIKNILSADVTEVLTPAKIQGDVKICVRDLVGKELFVDIWRGTLVSNVKGIVSRSWPIPESFQKLVIGERVLEDAQPLNSYLEPEAISSGADIAVLVDGDAVCAAIEKLKQGTNCWPGEAIEILNDLSRLGQRSSPEAVAAVSSLLTDPRLDVQKAACRTLVKVARRGDSEALRMLGEALQEPATRHTTVKALKLIAEVGDPDTVFLMIAFLEEHAERMMSHGMELKVDFHFQYEYDNEAEAKITRALTAAGYSYEDVEDVKFQAAILMWKTSLQYKCVGPPEQFIAWQAPWFVGADLPQIRVPPCGLSPPLSLILTVVEENNVGVCLAALEVLGYVGGRGNTHAIAAVARCLEDENTDVQWEAVKQLGMLIEAGDTFSIAHAKRLLKHEDRKVRWAAEEALGRFNEMSG